MSETRTSTPGECFRDKPERMLPLADPGVKTAGTAAADPAKKLAIVEIAGRDSVAAAILAVRAHGFTDILPVYAYTGTEHGPWHEVPRAVTRMTRGLPRVCVHDLCVMGSPLFWKALNGRFSSIINRLFGFISPCVGCHLYLHAVRIPLAARLNFAPIISGERESHSGMVKINQTPQVLDFYAGFAEKHRVPLLMPLRKTVDGNTIEKILGFEWERGKNQLQCALSGNYRDTKGGIVETGDVASFLTTFAGPCAKKIIHACTSGDRSDPISIAASMLEAI